MNDFIPLSHQKTWSKDNHVSIGVSIQFEPKKLELMTRIREFDNESHPPFLCANG